MDIFRWHFHCNLLHYQDILSKHFIKLPNVISNKHFVELLQKVSIPIKMISEHLHLTYTFDAEWKGTHAPLKVVAPHIVVTRQVYHLEVVFLSNKYLPKINSKSITSIAKTHTFWLYKTA